MKKHEDFNAYPVPTKEFHAKLAHTLDNLAEQTQVSANESCSHSKRGISFKRLAICAAAALVISTVAVAIAGGIASYQVSWSSTEYDFKDVPTEMQCIKAFGYVPAMVEEFSNGYKFDGAVTVHNTVYMEDGSNGNKYDSLNIVYAKQADGLSSEVSLHTGKAFAAAELDNFFVPGEKTFAKLYETHNGVNLYVNDVIIKLVPNGYVLSDSDIALEQTGRYAFSSIDPANFTGRDAFKIGQEVYRKNVLWVSQGVTYNLGTFGVNSISIDQLVQMAREIINSAG